MFGAIYFGQTYFGGVPNTNTTTGTSPCGARTFGGIYFGDTPRCDQPTAPPSVVEEIVVGRRIKIHPQDLIDDELEWKKIEELNRYDLDMVKVLTQWLDNI